MRAGGDHAGIATPGRVAAEGRGPWEAWMAAAQAGDDRAYEVLLGEALPLLRAVARRRLADPAEAEGAVQDALLSIHRLRHAHDPNRPLRPWLVTIRGRRCVDRLRRRGRRAGREIPLDALAEVLAAPGTADSAGRHVAVGEPRAAVAALPRTQRTALALAKLEDRSLAGASARSGLVRCLEPRIHAWSGEDLGGDEGIVVRLLSYAAPPLAEATRRAPRPAGFRCDWALNDARRVGRRHRRHPCGCVSPSRRRRRRTLPRSPRPRQLPARGNHPRGEGCRHPFEDAGEHGAATPLGAIGLPIRIRLPDATTASSP